MKKPGAQVTIVIADVGDNMISLSFRSSEPINRENYADNTMAQIMGVIAFSQLKDHGRVITADGTEN